MADDKEVTIVIRGKNLTSAEFDKARKELAGVDAQAKKTSAATTSLGSAFKAVSGALAGWGVYSAISGFADLTGQLTDMSAKTGIGVEALQRLKYAAEQNGGSLEQVTGAVSKLGANLAGGNASAKGALDALGLSFQSIRGMAPDKAFTTIADAIAKIPDPMAQSKLAMDLFGKSGAELLPMMKGNLSETAEAADRLGIVLSEEAVRAGDEFGDTMGTLAAVGKSVIAQVLEPMIPVLTTVAQWLGEKLPGAVRFIVDALSVGLGRAFLDAKIWMNEFILGVAEGVNKIPLLGKKIGFSAETLAGFRSNVQQAKESLSIFTQQSIATSSTQDTAAKTIGALNLNYEANEKATTKAATALQKSHKALADWNDAIDDHNAKVLRGMATMADFTKAIEVHTDRVAKGIISNALARKTYENELDGLVRERTLTRLNLEIEAVGRWAANEKLALDKSVAGWQATAAAIDRVAAAKVGALIEDDELAQMVLFANLNTDASKRVLELNRASKTAAYDGLASFFTSLGQISGSNGIGSVMTSLGNMVVGLQSADKWAQQKSETGVALGGSMGSLSVAFDSSASGAQRFAAAVQAAGVITQGVMTIWREAGTATTRLGGAFKGAMAGMQAGAAFGPWGAAIGAGAGVLISLFQDKVKKAVQAANVEIEKIRDNLIATYGPMDELQRKAELVGLSFTENWGHQGPAGLKAMQEMAKQLEERLRLVGEASGKAISGFASVATEMTRGYAEVGQRVRDAGQAYRDATAAVETLRASGTASADEIAAAVARQALAHERVNQSLVTQMSTGNAAKQSLADMGVQAIATFGAALASGQSYGQAIQSVGPSITTLGQAYKDLGLNVDDVGLKHLILQSTVATGNPELIAATSGLGSSMQGLAQLGLLNVDTFAAMQRTGMAMYGRLQTAVSEHGGTSRDALLPIQDYLHQAATQAELLGIPLDGNTQMLIDQSRELGIWKETGKSANDLLIEGMSALVGKVGELVDKILGVSGAIAAMPDRKTITFEASYYDPGPPSDFGDVGSRGSGESSPRFARGTFGTLGVDFPDFGSGTRAILDNREAVVPYEQRFAFAERVLAGAGGAGAAATVPATNVYIVGDTSREARVVSESEFQQIQNRLNGGGLTVPVRSISQRGR